MAPASPAALSIPSDDELDNILNDVADNQNMFATGNAHIQTERPKNARPATTSDGLGIDEEIKIVKKRQPPPKLDDSRLLSDPGIPKLRRISKERLRLKGKGHEYGDIARMLNMYQLWLDDLYPRAKFADGLTIIEKLGHSKRMQMMRKEWIDEGKPRHNREDAEEEDTSVFIPDEDVQMSARNADSVQTDIEGVEETQKAESQENTRKQMGNLNGETGGDDPDEDELDALLAESTAPNPMSTTAVLPSRSAVTVDDPFADDMEAMAEMEEMW